MRNLTLTDAPAVHECDPLIPEEELLVEHPKLEGQREGEEQREASGGYAEQS